MKVRVFTGHFGESYVDYDFDKYNAETGFEFAGADEYAVFNDMKAEFKRNRYKRVSDEEIVHLLYFIYRHTAWNFYIPDAERFNYLVKKAQSLDCEQTNTIKWHKASEYVDKMSKVKTYLALPKGYGNPRFISGNCSKEWILEYYEAICPITTDGMDEFRKETHNYGESKMVKASSLKVGDKIYYDYTVLTVKNNNDNKIEFDVQGISIDNLDTLVEKL